MKPEELGVINQKGLSRKHIFDSVKASLECLQVDYIDLLRCHRFDYDTPIEETVRQGRPCALHRHELVLGVSITSGNEYSSAARRIGGTGGWPLSWLNLIYSLRYYPTSLSTPKVID
ncbi:hypothetical protein L226DRAFT_207291 [Lentinus tigrinus ALCF2SS1-7]|uniref:uncharacterized protein n=1 Tax=Lentinus tigrinus ALCF2SS1-7 TaxID=1328758 RepID=UPI001165FFAF|nr:hypothetical protein L226DRAFT_207291 [Lentinus tigrinus ALCF2SS1-7]